MNVTYFENIYAYSKDLLNRLPLEKTIQPLEYAVTGLRDHLMKIRTAETVRLKELWSWKHSGTDNSAPVGLNTIGILTDRLTILIIKEWNLRNKMNNPVLADQLYFNQTKEIIATMAVCGPGNSSLNSKISRIHHTIKANDWEDAYFQLLSVNLVLWETQEVLYLKDIDLLPEQELRGYFKWFANGNMERNALIELAEIRFWENSLNNLPK